jgi:hypothetical protein
MLRHTISLARELTPPALWRALKLLAGRRPRPPAVHYQGVITPHDMAVLHSGRFAERYDRHRQLDPHLEPNTTRMRHYNLACLARHALNAPGDFLFAGVSYGVAARVLYDFLDWPTRGRVMHLVDPFLGVRNMQEREPLDCYNTDADYVRRQYDAADRSVTIHVAAVPDCLPVAPTLAFVHLNTGDYRCEAAALPMLYRSLSPRGVIVLDNYAIHVGHQNDYDPALAALKVEPFCLVTGQAVLFKP